LKSSERIVKSATGPEIAGYQFDEFRLDLKRRVLLRGDTPVRLRPKVFETLLYFLSSSGRVIEKEELMRAVWPDAVVEENNLNQSVSTLRRVLGHRRYILTVPTRGYRFTGTVHVERSTSSAESTSGVRKIAVLPFKAITPSAADEALELGMADTLIARLSHSHQLIVRPLSSVRRYLEADRDPQVAGQALGVEAVLDGSIQRAAGRIRVTVRMLRVPGGHALWNGTFDEEYTDLFSIQDIIAERVVNALSVRLTDAERKGITKRYTDNTQAYELYLTGRHCWNKLVPAEIRKAIQFFRRAVDLDPTYALAYLGMADCYRSLPITSDERPKEAFPLAKAALANALAIDDTIPELHAISTFIKFWYDWDWAGAECTADRAIRLNPHSSEARRARAHLFSNLGRHEEAIIEAEKARELDPLSLITRTLEARFLFYANHLPEAREGLEKTLQINPDFWVAHLTLGEILTREGRYAEAIKSFTRAKSSSGGNTLAISLLGYASARSGDRARALASQQELVSLSAHRYVPPHNVAVIQNGLGADTTALDSLEQACEERDVHLSFLRIDSKWDHLRTNPRFHSILQRLNLA
jgi:serine/threonine-protein kinase